LRRRIVYNTSVSDLLRRRIVYNEEEDTCRLSVQMPASRH
jgi:hypothetical protein